MPHASAQSLAEVARAIDEALLAPAPDEGLLPQLQELMETLREIAEQSEDLRRYRETRERMGSQPDVFLAPPNFPYTIQSS